MNVSVSTEFESVPLCSTNLDNQYQTKPISATKILGLRASLRPTRIPHQPPRPSKITGTHLLSSTYSTRVSQCSSQESFENTNPTNDGMLMHATPAPLRSHARSAVRTFVPDRPAVAAPPRHAPGSPYRHPAVFGIGCRHLAACGTARPYLPAAVEISWGLWAGCQLMSFHRGS